MKKDAMNKYATKYARKKGETRKDTTEKDAGSAG